MRPNHPLTPLPHVERHAGEYKDGGGSNRAKNVPIRGLFWDPTENPQNHGTTFVFSSKAVFDIMCKKFRMFYRCHKHGNDTPDTNSEGGRHCHVRPPSDSFTRCQSALPFWVDNENDMRRVGILLLQNVLRNMNFLETHTTQNVVEVF